MSLREKVAQVIWEKTHDRTFVCGDVADAAIRVVLEAAVDAGARAIEELGGQYPEDCADDWPAAKKAILALAPRPKEGEG
jgi:hypothetical protein